MTEEHILTYVSRRVYLIRGILAIAIGLSITLLIATNLKVHLHMMGFIGIDLIFTVSLFYLSKDWHKGQLSICFDKKEIHISSYFHLFRHSKEYVFSWEDLEDVSFYDSQYFRILVVKDQKNKISYAIDHGEEAVFEHILNKRLSKLKESGTITMGKNTSIYETKIGLGVAIVLGLLMIIWPLIAWLNNKEFKIGLAMLFYSGASFFIYMVYQHYKQKKVSVPHYKTKS